MLKQTKNVFGGSKARKGQPAIEYLILIGAVITFITLIAFILKERLLG